MIETGFSEININRAKYTGKNPWYLEVAITGSCNFKCKYCNSFKGDVDTGRLFGWLDTQPTLKHIQITGGEPTEHKRFDDIVSKLRGKTKTLGLSTNGSNYISAKTLEKIDMFSVSLDDYDWAILKLRGYRKINKVIDTIKHISTIKYVNVGMLIDELNVDRSEDIVDYILSLGVSDVKLSVSSHSIATMPKFSKVYKNYPILFYRVSNFKNGKPMRGYPNKTCFLAENDYTIVGDKHYPCLVYFREGGGHIGDVGDNMQRDRMAWSKSHICTEDPICSKFCMDFKCDMNNEISRRRGLVAGPTR